MMQRRRLLASGLALIPAALARAAPSAELRIGMQKVGPLVVLRKHRILEQLLPATRVVWFDFSAGPLVMEALNAGGIDFAYAGDAPPIFAQAAGVDLVYVGYQPKSGRNDGLLVRRDSPVRSVAELRGARVAVTRGSSGQSFLVLALQQAGLALSDIRVSYLQPADSAAAFSRGAVDAWAVWDPFFAVAEQDGENRVLATGAELAPSNNFFLARRAYAAADPALMLSLVAAMNDTAEWSRTHQEALSVLMSELTGVDLAAERVTSERGSFTAAVLDDAVIAQQQAVADIFASQRLIPAPVDIRAAVWLPPRSGSHA